MMEFIPVFKPLLGQDEIEACSEVLNIGWLGMGKNVGEFEERIQDFIENILRFLFIKIDPKLVDVMVSLAREDRPVALHTVQQDPTGEDYFQEEERAPRRGGGGGRRYEGKD